MLEIEGWNVTWGCCESHMGTCYLVDLLFGVCEESWEVTQSVTVEHHLSLFIRAGHNIPHRSQSCRLHSLKNITEATSHVKHLMSAKKVEHVSEVTDTTCSSVPELWPPGGSVRGRGKVRSPNQWPSGSARCRRQWDRTAPKPCPPGSAQNRVKSATRAVHSQTKSKSSTYVDISVVNEHAQRRENLYEDTRSSPWTNRATYTCY